HHGNKIRHRRADARCRDGRRAKCIRERRRAMARMVDEHQPAWKTDGLARHREVFVVAVAASLWEAPVCRFMRARVAHPPSHGFGVASRATPTKRILPRLPKTSAALPAGARAQRN